MIQQPELGKKISDLRKAKGLTQEDLVDKCNLSVRTLQRIEAGEVTPRPITIKLIFEALEVPFDKSQNDKGLILKWLEQFYISFIDLFNLKTNTMRKVIILIAIISTLSLSLYSMNNRNKKLNSTEVKSIIEKMTQDYIRQYNNGDIDSCMLQFSNDVCLINNWITIQGKDNVYNQLIKAIPQGYKMVKDKIETFNYSGDIAVVRGSCIVKSRKGEILVTKYMSEWHFIDDKWLKVNDIEVYQQ